MMVNGKPVDTAMVCSAVKPPPNNKAIAIAPSMIAQNTRCGLGASTLPPAVIESMTNEPESDEVTKKMITSTIAMNEVICDSGSC